MSEGNAKVRQTKWETENKPLSAQGSLVHGTFGRALLAGGAALQPDERTAEPYRGQNVFAAQRPSTASTSHAPTGRDQAPLCDQVGKEELFVPDSEAARSTQPLPISFGVFFWLFLSPIFFSLMDQLVVVSGIPSFFFFFCEYLFCLRERGFFCSIRGMGGVLDGWIDGGFMNQSWSKKRLRERQDQ